SSLAVSCWYRGWRPSPLTSIFSVIGNVTPYVVEQNVAISSDDPGSCSPNWLQGTPSTVNPLFAYCSWRRSRPSYCGVRPHLEATLTTRTALPLWSPRLPGSPFRVLIGMSWMDMREVVVRGRARAQKR